ncbi:metallophosphoesterase [Paenibacillus albidus]|uniref:metallophosphoesterase n=1 Tax=Paenibacillus albidus TaxID=2041023 RepID=UPI001BE9546A|nr:metallophosphoesterase [Paenibacillus albidus]MBT2289539.1 metallophosphoesterase [Paenibacillus albidus]
MSRLFAASDIHGHGYLLQVLLDKAGYNPAADRLFLLGDYVNKGPDSAGTLNLVDRLCTAGAVALQGNNERKWLEQVPDSAAPDRSAASWYQRLIARMPLWAEEDGYLFVHAGLRPGIPLAAQSAEDLTSIREPFFHSPPLKNKTVVFGHTPTFRFGLSPGEIWCGTGKLGIDTGAGHGHDLSLVELHEGRQWSLSVSTPNTLRKMKFRFT